VGRTGDGEQLVADQSQIDFERDAPWESIKVECHRSFNLIMAGRVASVKISIMMNLIRTMTSLL